MNGSRMRVGRVVWRLMVVMVSFEFCRLAAAQSPPPLAPFSPPSLATPLHTTFVDWNALAVRQIPQGLSRPVFDNPAAGLEKIEVHATTLKPGMTLHAPHHHAWEEMCLVREGEVQVTINGQKHRARAGSLVFFAAHDAHSIENASEQPAIYFVMNIVSPLARSVSDRPAAEVGEMGMLPSKVFDQNSVPATPDATGSTAKVFDSPTRTLTRLSDEIVSLDALQSASCELAPLESALCFVKSGRLEVTINGVSWRAGEGSFFYCEPNQKLAIKNIGTTPAVYQLIRIVPASAMAN